MPITRRETLALGAVGASSLLLPSVQAAVDDVPTADVKPPAFKIEQGASLHVLRPAKFIDPDEVFWKANTKRFIETTGIDVRVDFVSWEDLRPQTAVIANTGAGADMVCGFASDPHVYASKLVEMNDLAEYLGAKYGGGMILHYSMGIAGRQKTGFHFRLVAAVGRWCTGSPG